LEGPELERAVSDAFAQVVTEDDALRYIATSIPAIDEKAETVGYARFLIGDASGAEAALETATDPGLGRGWELEAAERAAAMLKLLRGGEDAAFRRRLDDWAKETAAVLKVARDAAVS
jgi:hypothetical protein